MPKEIKTIIVQAGGKGTRLKHLTVNKPKALVPIGNLPMIFHLFRKFPDKRFIVIGDYKCDVLEAYLKTFAEVDFTVVRATGKTGTCSGLNDALSLIKDESFLLIWCDLLLADDCVLPDGDGNYIGISKGFPCRWKYENGVFAEEPSSEHGVAGFFTFENKKWIEDVPDEGEFVRYLSSKNIPFLEHPLTRTHEYGLLEEWERIPKQRTRPFNKLRIEDGIVTKIPLDGLGRELAAKEEAWYRKAVSLGFNQIPNIYGFSPLRMQYIEGKPIHETGDMPHEERASLLRHIVDSLKLLHGLESVPADSASFTEAYLNKTLKRLAKVRDLVPFADEPSIVVNGKVVRNPLFYVDWIADTLRQYEPKQFYFIHGDCTFSNTMVTQDGSPVFLDPRGYFGNTKLYGDSAYDWAKLYYSVVGNYDQFNLRRFRLLIGDSGVELTIESNGYEDCEGEFFDLLKGEISKPQMVFFHSLIWLSLTTYAWEDYDSICGAFYNGAFIFEEAMKLHGN